jgi:hypothetical protein
MKKLLLIATVLGAAFAANATFYSTNWTSGFANGGVIPDDDFSGWSDSRTLSGFPAGTVSGVAVTMNLSGGWNGDLYAYLVNSSGGFCVLLNHVGTPGQPLGYSNPGFGLDGLGNAFTLSAAGAYSVHDYQAHSPLYNGSGQLTGTWLPDASGANPGGLGSFTTSGGTWSLFIADTSGGGVTTVQSWGLQMDIVAVPEVESWVAAALAGAFGAFWLNRQIWGPREKC